MTKIGGIQGGGEPTFLRSNFGAQNILDRIWGTQIGYKINFGSQIWVTKSERICMILMNFQAC